MLNVNRIGFTLLSGSEGAGNGPYRVNVLFVHGLRGHPRHTWEDGRASSSDKNTATPKKWKSFRPLFKKCVLAVDNTSGDPAPETLFWLEEFLTGDVPDARVWTYGYNADVIGGLFQANNKNSVSQHSRDLAVKLEREIENEDPIIFVAHSLGGIVVKDALRRSGICQSRTKAIIFLGTPHRGSTYAGWGAIASNLAKVALQDSNKKIVETLDVNSEVLDNIHEEFKTIVHMSSIGIHSFQEARGISGVKGLHNKVVDDYSSKIDLPQALETVEGIDANHMEMARCRDRADPRYRAILGVLKQFIRTKVSCVNSGPQDMPSMSHFETLTTATQVPVTSSERSGTVFRVTGLSALQPDDELKEALKAAIDDNLMEDEQLKLAPNIVIVPSCYNNDEKVALVEFYGGVPAFLSELIVNPLGDWPVETGDTDISFDQHFFGFTQLYTPKPGSPATADIIAITGLDGHAYDSWRAKKNLKRMWLRDFLSKDLPCCRTMIYGYNSKLSSHGINTIMDYGREFLEAIKRIRHTQEARCIARLRERPLFFIAHSSGGIILGHCLVKAVQTDERDNATIAALHKATYGILFFGAPHKGLVTDDIQRMVAGENQHPRMELLKQIDLKSNLLMHQLVDFKKLICDRKIVSFYEMRQTRRLQLNSETNKWRRTGEYMTAVDSGSALLELPDSTEAKIPVDADHSQIVKFDNRNAEAYKTAVGYLKEFEQDARKVVSDRFLQAKNGTSSERSGPLRVLPFGRNKNFVGRQSKLNQLITILHTEDTEEDCQRAALVGLGGVGKTQIALECAFQLQSASPTCSVFWVQASDAASFENAYRNIGQQLKIPGLDNEKADVKKLVKAWLSQESSGKWLMVVDNADDYEMFYSSNDRDGSYALSEYLPFSTLGAILFTTRDREAATRYASSDVIDIDEMDDRESRELLQQSLQNKQLMEDKDSITTLLKLVVNIPLAIMQAVAYLNAKGSTIADYLRIYEDSSNNVIKLLSKDFEDIRRYPSMKNPVATTWLISFEQIQVRDPLAADYMAFISCVKEQDIPRNILPPASEFDKSEALGTLKAFGFIKERHGGASYDIHRLVHTAMQNWLKLKDEWRSSNEKTLNQITDAFPWPQHENRDVWMMCLPHVQCAIATFEKSFGETKDLPWNLLQNLAQSLRLQGKYAEAEVMLRQTLQLQETVLGKDHPETLTNMNNLAELRRHQGKYAEAEAMHRQTLQLTETVLGKDHPDTLASTINLAASLHRQGKYARAEAMLQQTLQLQETVLGKDHPDTLASTKIFAISLGQQGKYAEAEAMLRQTLQLQETVLGKDHPDTLSSMNDLAVLLRQQGKYAEAEAMDRQAI